MWFYMITVLMMIHYSVFGGLVPKPPFHPTLIFDDCHVCRFTNFFPERQNLGIHLQKPPIPLPGLYPWKPLGTSVQTPPGHFLPCTF